MFYEFIGVCCFYIDCIQYIETIYRHFYVQFRQVSRFERNCFSLNILLLDSFVYSLLFHANMKLHNFWAPRLFLKGKSSQDDLLICHKYM